MIPYYADESVALYHGRYEDVLPVLGVRADLVIADPPYGETALVWDRWPVGWPVRLADYTDSMWVFGSMRMMLDRAAEFRSWKFSQDVVWEKQNGTGFTTDRFKRVHEHVTHWYRGDWSKIYHVVPREPRGDGTKSVSLYRRGPTPHTGDIGTAGYTDDGYRMTRSVIHVPNMHATAINETEKPTGILRPLIAYACKPGGGLILDPFAGSASTLVTARAMGYRAIGIEARESQCETAALRLAQTPLFVD